MESTPKYETREDRTARLYDEVPTTQRVSTHVIKTVEKDVRTVLDRLEHEYTNEDTRQAIRRLRKWVGYQA